MAKKIFESLKKKDVKNYAKVIREVRSENTGSYIFKEEIVTTDLVKEVLAKK